MIKSQSVITEHEKYMRRTLGFLVASPACIILYCTSPNLNPNPANTTRAKMT